MPPIPTALRPLFDIPDADAIRTRLAVVLTEANVLRRQLRVSVRADRERERLGRLGAGVPDSPKSVAVAGGTT